VSLKRWVVKRVAYHRLKKAYRRSEDMKTIMEWLQGKKTVLATLSGAAVSVLTYFQQSELAEFAKQAGDALVGSDPKMFLMAAAGFMAWLFDRVGRKRENEKVIAALNGKS
jgi:hypothetical protein